MTELTLRTATAADVPTLADLNRHVHDLHLAAEPGVYRPTDPEALRAWFADLLQQPEAEVVLAARSGVPVGFVSVRLVEHPAHVFAHGRSFLLVDQLVVDPAVRRQGVGRALMAVAHQRAATRGVHRVELDVRGFNDDARRFYASLGYRVEQLRMARTDANRGDEPEP